MPDAPKASPDRYSRQTLFSGIGPEGQRRICASTAVVAGCGALGSVIANALARAGVGNLRIIDRDFVEESNLHRQVLFDEQDCREHLPKAAAAERKLKAINSAIAISKGKYLMKVDAHCMFPHGFDEVLKADCDGDWVVIPRRYSLELDTWGVRFHRPFIDYEFLGWPYEGKKAVHGDTVGLHARAWDFRTEERIDRLLDENQTFQGSCWFTSKEHFEKRIGFLQEEG